MMTLLDTQVAPVAALVCIVLLISQPGPGIENICWPVVGTGLDMLPPVGGFVCVFISDFVGDAVGREMVGIFVSGDVGLVEDGRLVIVFVGDTVSEVVGVFVVVDVGLVEGGGVVSVFVGNAVGELVGVFVGGDVGLVEGGGPTSLSVLPSPAGAAGVDAGSNADEPC